MGYNYQYGYTDNSTDQIAMFILGIYLVVVLFACVMNLALYVVKSLSVYTIAKRRGLNSPWLAWIPVGSEWIIGSLSDQYKYLTQGKVQNRRKVLLGLSIAGVVCSLLTFGVSIMLSVSAAMSYGYTPDDAVVFGSLGLVLVCLVYVVINAVMLVFAYMCKYDIYKSCDPRNAVAFLVISIFINVTEPFFLLACRNKDLGMPPRKDAVPVQPAWTAEQAPVLPVAEAPAAPVQETPAEPVEESPAEPEEELPEPPAESM